MASKHSPSQDISGGKQSNLEETQVNRYTPTEEARCTTRDITGVGAAPVPPFPSARDVLQPLSHRTPLPTSGSVAAAVKERSNPNSKAEQKKKRQEAISDQPEYCHQQMSHSRSVDPPQSTAHHPEEAIYPSFQSPNHRSRSCPDMCHAKAVGGNSLSFSRSPAAVSDSRLEHMRHDECSVQKRSETVQLLHERDGVGLRSWKRVIVEYS